MPGRPPVVFALLLAAAWACSNSTASPVGCAGSGADATVMAVSTVAFSPALQNIAVGQSVCWENTTGVPHTVSSDDSTSFDAPLAANQVFVQVFSTPGTIPYHCKIHPNMTGSIAVH
jgi:plastocyanin